MDCLMHIVSHLTNRYKAGWCFPNHNTTAPANVSFVYHTHPFIVQEYFNGSAGCGRTERNATELAIVAAAIRRGDIAWHAKPFTMIHELCHPDVFAWSLNIRFVIGH
jgi:hypothetical protein